MAATLLVARSTAATRSYSTVPRSVSFSRSSTCTTPTYSCEYEKWQNPIERHMRTQQQEPMRVMHERDGGAGKEYWEFSVTQASLISNVMHHRWGAAIG
eukprot:6213469-Pleurochrysis_carterae.AAC.1